MTISPCWMTRISPVPVRDLAMQVDDLFTSHGFIKDFLYMPPDQDAPPGYCVAGAVNKVLTGSWSYPRQGQFHPADPEYMHGPMQDFAIEFGAVAANEFPALWLNACMRVAPGTVNHAPTTVLNMVSFNNHPDVTLADMRRILMLMR